MQVGDKVVCIKVDDFNIHSLTFCPHPKKGDELIILRVRGDGWITFSGYEDYAYEPWNFRPIQPRFTNALTKKLSNDFKEYDQIETETPKEITI